jgi:hypothetical protein
MKCIDKEGGLLVIYSNGTIAMTGFSLCSI